MLRVACHEHGTYLAQKSPPNACARLLQATSLNEESDTIQEGEPASENQSPVGKPVREAFPALEGLDFLELKTSLSSAQVLADMFETPNCIPNLCYTTATNERGGEKEYMEYIRRKL